MTAPLQSPRRAGRHRSGCRGGPGRDGGRHRGRRKPGGLAVAASCPEHRPRAHRPRMGRRPGHQPGGDVEDGRAGRLAAGADRARGRGVRRQRPARRGPSAAAPRTVKLGTGRTVTHYKAEFIGLTPSDAVCLPGRQRLLVQQLALFHHRVVGPAPFRFIYLGDAQNGLERKWPRGCAGGVCRRSRRALRRARGRPGGRRRRRRRSGANGWRASARGRRNRPACPLPGNHDVIPLDPQRDGGTVFTAPNLWNAHFALPANGPPDLPELAGQNYYLDYQGVRIVALDVNAFANDAFKASQRSRVRAAQVTWLRRGSRHESAAVDGGRAAPPDVLRREAPRLQGDAGGARAALRRVPRGPRAAGPRPRLRAHAQGASTAGWPIRRRPARCMRRRCRARRCTPSRTRWAPLMARLPQDAQLYQVVSVTGDRLSYESRAAGRHGRRRVRIDQKPRQAATSGLVPGGRLRRQPRGGRPPQVGTGPIAAGSGR